MLKPPLFKKCLTTGTFPAWPQTNNSLQSATHYPTNSFCCERVQHAKTCSSVVYSRSYASITILIKLIMVFASVIDHTRSSFRHIAKHNPPYVQCQLKKFFVFRYCRKSVRHDENLCPFTTLARQCRLSYDLSWESGAAKISSISKLLEF